MADRFLVRHRRRLLILGGVLAGIGLFLWLLPIGLRMGAEYWLTEQGMTADIEDIDLNLFTGTLAVTEAQAENPDGNSGFDIEYALVDLHYLALFSKQIYLSTFKIRNSSISARRSPAGEFWIAGLPMTGGAEEEPPEDEGTPWGFGLDRADIESLTLTYRAPDYERSVTLSTSSAQDVATWQPQMPIPLSADMSIGDANIELTGNIQPFGERIVGDLNLRIEDFALDLVAPLARQAEVAELAGTVNSDLDIGLDYSTNQGLVLQMAGQAGLGEGRIALPTGSIQQVNLDWDGSVNAELLQREGDDRVAADGKLVLQALDLRLPEVMDLQQQSLNWQGQAEVALASPTRIGTDGSLETTGTDLTLTGNDMTLSLASARWSGTTDTRLARSGMEVATDGHLQTGTTELEIPEQLQFSQANLSWNGKTQTTLAEAGPSAQAEGVLEAAETQIQATGLNIRQQSLNWNGQADYAPGESAVVHSQGRLVLGGTDLELADARLTVGGQQLVWEGSAGLDPQAEGMPADGELALTADGQFTAAQLTVADNRRQRRLLNVDSLKTGNIRARGINDIQVASARADTARALERAAQAVQSDEFPYVIRLTALNLGNLRYGNQRLAIGSAQADTLGGFVLRQEDGGFEFVEWLDQVEEPDETDESAFDFAIGQIAISGDTQLVLTDRTVAPDVALTVQQIDLSLENLDSTQPAQASSISLTANIGRYGDIRTQGSVKPFGGKLSLNMDGTIKALNLVPLSGYVAAAIERRVTQGTLDAKIDLDINAGDLDGIADLSLSKFRLGGVVGDSGAVESNLGLPLDKVLSLLRDGDGNIQIELPISGDIANPQFSFNDIIQQAIFQGIKSAVISYYSPLGVFTVGKKLVDLATALRFDPVTFAPGDTELDDKDTAYLDKMAGILEDKPEAQFVVCGHAVPADRKPLDLPATETEDANQEALQAARNRLLGLARERTFVVTDYLTDQGISGNRLIPCNPALGEAADAQPRTTISF